MIEYQYNLLEREGGGKKNLCFPVSQKKRAKAISKNKLHNLG